MFDLQIKFLDEKQNFSDLKAYIDQLIYIS